MPAKVIDVKLVAFWNALEPILVTLVGMVINVKPVVPVKANAKIDVTELGTIYCPTLPEGNVNNVV